MSQSTHSPKMLRFGVFDLDLRAGELRKAGARVKLQPRLLQLLLALLERPGVVVTREELRQRLWPADTFVDFDLSLNSSLKKLRYALGDVADSPIFIETVPRRGYRFIATVKRIDVSDSPQASRLEVESSQNRVPQVVLTAGRKRGAWQSWKPVGRTLLIPTTMVVAVFLIAISRWPAHPPVLNSPPAKLRSLAVLPLENLSHDPAQDYFADGMTDELITTLGQIGSLRVISRTSAMHYRGTRKSLSEIARELNVDAIVEGTVLWSGKHVRITAELIQVASDQQLWAQSYEGNIRDVLGLQNEVGRAIAKQVRSALIARDEVRVGVGSPGNLKAYEAYLKGEYFLNRATPDSVRTAADYFQQAIDKDPNYVPAYTKAAGCYQILAAMGSMSNKVAYPKARLLLAKALRIDPQFSAAHAVLGWNILLYDLDFPRAGIEFKRALELNPNGVEAHHGLSNYYASIGQTQEAVEEIQYARELDPLATIVNSDLCKTLYFARRFDEALAQCKSNLDLNPNSVGSLINLANVYAAKGMDSEAISTSIRLLKTVGAPPAMVSAGSRGAVESGLKGYWKALLPFIPDNLAQGNIDALDAAIAYTYAGDDDKAMMWLEKAVEARCFGVTYLGVNPTFDRLRSDSRFISLLTRTSPRQHS
jgi:TolB-like protein/DNA-binding winged helix-turn-helix (wHTH) protein/Flp pilus assembly protein TadD